MTDPSAPETASATGAGSASGAASGAAAGAAAGAETGTASGTASTATAEPTAAAGAASAAVSAPRHRGPATLPFRPSLAGRLTAAVVLVLVIQGVFVAGMMRLTGDPWLGLLLAMLIGIPIGAWLVSRILRPLDRTLSGLHFGIASFNDHDFSVRLASDRTDELGDLARLYNQVGETLRDERLAVRSKELLLSSALDHSPVAVVLVNPRDRVVFSNLEARRLLTGGDRLEGRLFAADIRQSCPPEMREILAGDGDGVFSVRDDDSIETYHLSRRGFVLNRRKHVLVLLYRMTAELGRREAAIWKKVIRVISHELNNSLAPVSSLVHSAELISRRPEHAGRAEEVFATIRDRLGHLRDFIDGYARFARLPAPRREESSWSGLVEGLDEFPTLTIDGPLPSRPVRLDRAQFRQLLVNLLMNAAEASDSEPEISLRVVETTDGVCVQILDRGRGMDEETMKRALLPFYSTKKTGSGLGLALCREIVEGHGGRISLQQRPGGGTIVSCWFPDHR